MVRERENSAGGAKREAHKRVNRVSTWEEKPSVWAWIRYLQRPDAWSTEQGAKHPVMRGKFWVRQPAYQRQSGMVTRKGE
ncbi:hypothetical protein RJT34_16691 [Clitoria ternatea]|uniref:Uncharacterized protein n=1 Tax=Clitoria ternatea TaxID=43366 RepID=A0AAN9J8W4_CLITE